MTAIPLHIDEGEQEGATGGEAMPGPGDDPGRDGIHGEDAGVKARPRPRAQEGGDADPEPWLPRAAASPSCWLPGTSVPLKAGRRFPPGRGRRGARRRSACRSAGSRVPRCSPGNSG